ncbi:MAG: carboxypeptidase regulatory-like domain-containing protein [Acidobacteria bacterium]|nr:carboxypeptidase regulatory-like domain-containing protein [Acidobacteriota bacterium]
MPKRNRFKFPIALLTALFAFVFLANDTHAEVEVENGGAKFGVIKGVVRDNSGDPISNATVAVFQLGTSNLLKQVTATSSGKFFAKILPGTYTILAVAQGFNPVTLNKVTVGRSSELVYGFKLEPSGRGNTLPEKRADRNSSKWRIRAASRRSIYQNSEGDLPVDVDSQEDQNAALDPENAEQQIGIAEDEEKRTRKGQTIVETYVSNVGNDTYAALNFATVRPVGDNAQLMFAGQIGEGANAPKRFETSLSFNKGKNHRLNIKGSIANLGNFQNNGQNELLGQASFQALDQWKVREGVIVVLGLDYSRFLGAGNDSSISPRLGLQFDVDSKTRVRAAYTTQTEPRTWQRVIDLENTQVLFREPVAIEDIAVKDDKPLMNKNRRLEFGIERILDQRSSIEANVFFDAVIGRGVGLTNLPFDGIGRDQIGDLVGSQHGKAEGVRVVYSRRLNGTFNASAGYSFGNGQKLSENVISDPSNAFEKAIFQTFFGQVSADFKSGTSVRTIYRLSPNATVFAIDPFEGRLAIYDPGLSVMVTQDLPNWGLPIDAEAVLDAKNLLDIRNGLEMQEGTLLLNSQRRIFRGGILVRF